jgi:serine protease AprX
VVGQDVARGGLVVSGNSRPRGRTWRAAGAAVLASAIAVGVAGPAAASPAAVPAASTAPLVTVIVTQQPGAGDGPERAVAALGGSVVRQIGLIDAFTATVPADRLGVLRAVPGVREVTEDAHVTLDSTEVANQAGQSGSLDSITTTVGAVQAWTKGVTGKGVDVALIDSGVVPVEGLKTAGKVLYGPDLSFDAQSCDATGGSCTTSAAAGYDGFGHGTAMAGIIAGRDGAAPGTLTATSGDTDFLGVAPDARIVSVKVADAGGSSDVSQVIAGIDWVVANRTANGMNIRVLNLSFGTDGVQDYQLDPLAYAAEAAWRAGIVVVVSAGNRGSSDGKLTNPAYDPNVLAVGAVDDQGTKGTIDDVIPAWSQRGDGVRNPDLVAPGAGVVSLRDPNGFLDSQYPTARIGSRFFRGSGTSQAAAVVSGGVALLLQKQPKMTPDQVKAVLTATAKDIPSADQQGQGNGMVNLSSALNTVVPSAAAAAQPWAKSTGLGSLDAARGTARVQQGGVALTGETDVFGTAWNAPAWAAAAAGGTTWTGSWSKNVYTGSYLGRSWLGHGWNAETFTGQSWGTSGWTNAPWASDTSNLASKTWAAKTWADAEWAAKTWAAKTWASATWASATWASATWASKTWG